VTTTMLIVPLANQSTKFEVLTFSHSRYFRRPKNFK